MLSIICLIASLVAVNAQLNCFFNPDDATVLGTLDAGSAAWWNSTTSIGWSFNGTVFSTQSGLLWHIHQFIPSDLTNLATTGAHYNTQPWNEGELSTLFGNLTLAKLSGANATLANAYPFATSGNPIIGRSLTLKNAGNTDVACCNIGFYQSGGVSTVRCQFVGSQDVTGYVDFTPSSVLTNVSAISSAFNGQNASWEIRTHSIYGANCGNTLPVYNSYVLDTLLSTKLNLGYSGNSDVRTISTAAFVASASAAATGTIAGRSITLHNPDGSRFATCPLGYGIGPQFDAPPTPSPAPTTAAPTGTGGAQSLVVFLSLLFSSLAFVLLL